MLPQDQKLMLLKGLQCIGGGYGPDLCILAGALLTAVENVRPGDGEFPIQIIRGLQEFESRAIAEERRISMEKISLFQGSQDVADIPLVTPSTAATPDESFRFFRKFDLHRLPPIFQSERLNNAIQEAKAEYAASHPKPKGFWERLLG